MATIPTCVSAAHSPDVANRCSGSLRDAEKDLASWRNSPLRPLIEDLAASLDDDAREEIQDQVDQSTARAGWTREVVATAERISERLIAIAGGNMPFRYRRTCQPESTRCCSLRLLIDNGVRGVGDASLGTANLIFPGAEESRTGPPRFRWRARPHLLRSRGGEAHHLHRTCSV